MSFVSKTPTLQKPSMTELLASVSKLSGHRQVLIRLNWMLEDETRGASDLVALLKMDPGLSARVISVSNTSLFRGGTRVCSVEEAVVRVGVWEIRKMLLSSILREMTLGALRTYNLAPGALWNRSLLAAISMEALSSEAHRSSDSCYTVGLLHCSGLVVIDRWLTDHHPVRLPRVGSIDDPGLGDRERELVGSTGEEIGAALLESWKFPENIIRAIEHRRKPADAGRYEALAALLHVAHWCARAVEELSLHRPPPPAPDPAVMEAAGAVLADVRKLLPDIQRKCSEHKSSVGGL